MQNFILKICSPFIGNLRYLFYTFKFSWDLMTVFRYICSPEIKIHKIVLGTHVFLPVCTLISHSKVHIYFKIKTLKVKPVHLIFTKVWQKIFYAKNKNWNRNKTFNLWFFKTLENYSTNCYFSGQNHNCSPWI